MLETRDLDARESFDGIMLINGIHLSVNPPPMRAEENYFELIEAKLTKALELSCEMDLLPILCGPLAQRYWDMDIFKLLFRLAGRYPQMLIIGEGNMLTRTGELKPKSTLDLLSSTGGCEIMTPLSNRNFSIVCNNVEYHFTLDSEGGFHVSIDQGNGSKHVIARLEDLPRLARVTQLSASEDASVVCIRNSALEPFTIEKGRPILSDARFDVSDIEDHFSSQLVSRLSQMLALSDSEEPSRTVEDKLKSIFEKLETPAEARSIVLDLQEKVGASEGLIN